jgi:hypothetical protein
LLCAALLLLTGCPGGAGRDSGTTTYAAPKASKYPIDFPDRPYTQVHAKVREAWQLVEVSYFVVNQKYAQASKDTKENVAKEIDENIFGVNAKVEALFKAGIKAEPDNPLNYAAYAIYLKPRKRLKDVGFEPTWDESLAQIDKAIELWPDESSFYITKIYIMTAPHQAHEWMRAGAMEDIAIAEQMDAVGKLFVQAEKYDPQNAFINYWHAQLLFRYTDPEQFDRIKDKLLREIKAGNAKKENYFYFGAPLQPKLLDPRLPVLTAEETEPIYFDQLVQFGNYSRPTINTMVETLLGTLSWPRDKDDIAALMFFYYNLGRTEPYDNSYFSMQQMIMDKIRLEAGTKSKDSTQLAAAGRFLEEQYLTVANQFFDLKVIQDPAKVNQVGLNQLEESGSRKMNLRLPLQQYQASFLKRFGELFGIEFPLHEDPQRW